MAGTLLVLALVVLAVRAMALAVLALAFQPRLVAVVFRAVVPAAVALVVALSQAQGADGEIIITYTQEAVPEPCTFAPFGVGVSAGPPTLGGGKA